MFKKSVLIAVAILVVGCSSQGVKNPESARTSSNGLQNFNVAEDKHATVDGKNLPFVGFIKKEQTIVTKQHQRVKVTTDEFGSGIQWNEDYVVTAKHVNFVKDSAYNCHAGCEIQFVKRKATAPVPVWRKVVAFEPITFVGMNQKDGISSAAGKDINQQMLTTLNFSVKVNVAATETVPGMSGGPAYTKDGAVVGILTGAADVRDNPDLNKFANNVSFYVDYADILAEWQKFEIQQKQVAAK